MRNETVVIGKAAIGCPDCILGAIIAFTMKGCVAFGVSCAMALVAVGSPARPIHSANHNQTPKTTMTSGSVPTNQSYGTPSAFTVVGAGEKVRINGREWRRGDLRPAWASGQKRAPRSRNQSSRTRARRSRAGRVYSRYQSR